MLPTILSRCRKIAFRRPSLAEGTSWLRQSGHQAAAECLALAGGAPLVAIQEAQRGTLIGRLLDTLQNPGNDALRLAAQWEGMLKSEDGLSMETFVVVLQKWVFDLASMKLTGGGRFLAANREAMASMLERATAMGLIRCYNELLRVRRLAGHPLNPRLLMEETAERYLRALAVSR